MHILTKGSGQPLHGELHKKECWSVRILPPGQALGSTEAEHSHGQMKNVEDFEGHHISLLHHLCTLQPNLNLIKS